MSSAVWFPSVVLECMNVTLVHLNMRRRDTTLLDTWESVGLVRAKVGYSDLSLTSVSVQNWKKLIHSKNEIFLMYLLFVLGRFWANWHLNCKGICYKTIEVEIVDYSCLVWSNTQRWTLSMNIASIKIIVTSNEPENIVVERFYLPIIYPPSVGQSRPEIGCWYSGCCKRLQNNFLPQVLCDSCNKSLLCYRFWQTESTVLGMLAP